MKTKLYLDFFDGIHHRWDEAEKYDVMAVLTGRRAEVISASLIRVTDEGGTVAKIEQQVLIQDKKPVNNAPWEPLQEYSWNGRTEDTTRVGDKLEELAA